MNKLVEKILIAARNRYAKIYPKPKEHLIRETNPDNVSSIIFEELVSSRSSMICRFGGTEFQNLLNYISIKSQKKNYIDFIRGKQNAWWWRSDWTENLKNLSGFFPLNSSELNRFCEMFLNIIGDIDVLASWIDDEIYIKHYLNTDKVVFLPYLEPYWAGNPWTRALENKNILVVHPFALQIKKQYEKNRDKLFDNNLVLPKFNLIPLEAVQSLGGVCDRYQTWFDALRAMEDKIDSENFDICLIGCGAYGIFLAHHVKKLGKKGVHMGGALQMMFGIKGNRWENPNYGVAEWGLPYGFYTNLINGYWVKAGDRGKPKNAANVENACYW